MSPPRTTWEVANGTSGHNSPFKINFKINWNASNAATTQAFFKTLIGLRKARAAPQQRATEQTTVQASAGPGRRSS